MIKIPFGTADIKKIDHIGTIDRAQITSSNAVVSGPARHTCSSDLIWALGATSTAAGRESRRAWVSINVDSSIGKRPPGRL